MKKLLIIMALPIVLQANAQKYKSLVTDTLQAKYLVAVMVAKPVVAPQEDSLMLAGLQEPGISSRFEKLGFGNGPLLAEHRSWYSLSAMMVSPADHEKILLVERPMDALMNSSIMAVSKDSLGKEGITYAEKDSVQTWLKPLQNGEWALCFLNNSNAARDLFFAWRNTTVSYPGGKFELNVAKNNFLVKDLWLEKEIGTTGKPMNATIGAHDVLLLKLVKQNSKKK